MRSALFADFVQHVLLLMCYGLCFITRSRTTAVRSIGLFSYADSLCGVAQLVDARSLLLALHFAKAADNPYFRIGYNSLGAYGTINHLHFQVRLLSKLELCVMIAKHRKDS